MIENEQINKIDFKPFTLQNRSLYESYLFSEGERGSEFSFANLYLWGQQSFSVVHGHIVLFSRFGSRTFYPYPLGIGDKREVLNAVIADAKAKGIPCRITGLNSSSKHIIEELYPGKFHFHSDEGNFDYVYSIDDLADLKGKKYHGKRNHLNRFFEAHPNYTTRPIDENNIHTVKQFTEDWFKTKLAEAPDADFHMEQAALCKAFRDFKDLGMDGLVLLDGEKVLGFTLASHLSEDTLDVHFEKARSDIQGAYSAVNYEFARLVRNKYPNIRYIDREEDMGIEGLRKAKQSYYPHHMVKKFTACLLEDGYGH